MSDASYEFRPRPIYGLVVFVAAAAGATLVSPLFGFRWTTIIGPAIGATIGMLVFQRLHASEAGLALNKRLVNWNDVELHRGRFGDSLKTPKGTAARQKLSVFIPFYVPDWPNSTFRRDVVAWAPHLDEQTD